jgi:Flp pilus assembly protein TadG
MKEKMKNPRSESGQSLVEMAFSITFLIMLVAGVVDLGRAFFTYIALRDAAQEGAAYASIARIYQEGPMMCTEIESRVHTTSNTQIVDLTQTDVDTSYFDFFDINLTNPYNCTSLDPENSSTDNTHACLGSTVLVSVTYPNFPLSTPFLGSILGTQTIPIRATIEDTVLTPPCH